MGQVSCKGTFISLLINGTYKGYYNLTERVDDEWARFWYGGVNGWDVSRLVNDRNGVSVRLFRAREVGKTE
jgi:hypothetical protein